jgi:hypothetical protein
MWATCEGAGGPTLARSPIRPEAVCVSAHRLRLFLARCCAPPQHGRQAIAGDLTGDLKTEGNATIRVGTGIRSARSRRTERARCRS